MHVNQILERNTRYLLPDGHQPRWLRTHDGQLLMLVGPGCWVDCGNFASALSQLKDLAETPPSINTEGVDQWNLPPTTT